MSERQDALQNTHMYRPGAVSPPVLRGIRDGEKSHYAGRESSDFASYRMRTALLVPAAAVA